MKGKGLTVLEETPELLRAKNATHILSEVGWLKLKLTYLTCTPLQQHHFLLISLIRQKLVILPLANENTNQAYGLPLESAV